MYKELVLDLELQAFYPNELSDRKELADYVKYPSQVKTTFLEDVYVGTEQVYVGVEVVQTTGISSTERIPDVAYLTMEGDNFTIAKFTNRKFYDWSTANYDSYLVTGYDVFQDIMRKKQATYLTMLFERTETGFVSGSSGLIYENPSSCIVQSQWNWANTSAGGKWGTPFQAYRYTRHYNPTGPADKFDTGDSVLVTRNKLRGTGRALSLYFQSEEGKDFHILGWGLPVTIGTTV